ncbi:MAG: hypothetical protein JWQ97_3738, partial [Phenylobacterium sp.]|nr:hypothetical protein [Phenylobacterium sp.]MDB5448421.1 hypothetical protein [Phenylobacterium sp.]
KPVVMCVSLKLEGWTPRYGSSGPELAGSE